MNLSEILPLVDPRWHSSFVRFVESGDADEDFARFLDEDEDCQKAVEMAFAQQASALETLAQGLRGNSRGAEGQSHSDVLRTSVTARVATALGSVLQLSPQARGDALREAVIALRQTVSPEQRKELEGIVKTLEAGLASQS